MPRQIRGPGILGRVTQVNRLVGIVRELRVDDIRREADQRPTLLVVAPDRERASHLGQCLVGWTEDRSLVARSFDDDLGDLNRFDVIIAFDPEAVGRVADLRANADKRGVLAPIVRHDAAAVDDDKSLEATRRRVLDVLPDRVTAFGRAFPPFRMAASLNVINTTARVNAQFALVSNIPAIIPVFGSLVAASADLVVLTKNQLLLLYKVAAIHGRDLRDTMGIFREMVPVVGAALVWRTVAREAASFLPFAAGTVPKVAIAYAGTMAAGRGADFYYRFGYPPTRAQRKEFYRQATLDLVKNPIAPSDEEPSE